MAYLFMSAEWAQALKDAINASAAYREAAADWEGDFFFVADTKGDNPTVYLDLWHGECREAYRVSEAQAKTPEFEVSGKLSAWKKIVGGNLDPIQGLLTRQLKLKGNMAKILRSVAAAKELVNAAASIPTEFPE